MYFTAKYTSPQRCPVVLGKYMGKILCNYDIPIADFCWKYGHEEIDPALCNIDHVTVAMMHSRRVREHTVAKGAGICDYWTVGDKVGNPQ